MPIQDQTVPGFSTLVQDYFRFNGISSFFRWNFADENDIRQALQLRQHTLQPNALLAQILADQNQAFGCGEATLKNIDLLRQGKTLAIVTGQQAGLFSGPLYTIHKAMTTVHLARHWQQKFAVPLVPVFWLVSEDHDFEEVQCVQLPDANNQLRRICYQPEVKPNRQRVCDLTLDANIHATFEALSACLPASDFKAEILAQLNRCYTTGQNFARACACWLTQLFAPFGVIILDAADARLKRLAQTVFIREIAGKTESAHILKSTSDRIQQQGYQAQITPNVERLNLFYLENGRHSIQIRGDKFVELGQGREFSADALLEIAHQQPERLSPNVVLRPIVQDSVLPTAAYVAGPGEIAYFAQLQAIYQFFRVPMPVIYPRKSLTIVENKIKRHLERFQLSLVDVWQGAEALQTRLARAALPADLVGQLHALRQQISVSVAALRGQALQIDPTLEGVLTTSHQALGHELDRLEAKILKAIKNRSDTMVQQLNSISNHLFPGDILQERTMNIAYYLCKYHWDFIRRLDQALEIDNFNHQLFYL